MPNRPERNSTKEKLPEMPEDPNKASAPVDDVFSTLDYELVQETRTSEGEYTLLEVDAEAFREREREYKDVEKHWVRTQGWRTVARHISQLKAKQGRDPGLRYLTLPAYYRLDVSVLLREDLIEITDRFPDGLVREVYVAAFETDPTKFGRMQGQSPRFVLLGRSSIESALTDPRNEYYHQLRDLFPFDVINLDLTSTLTPQHEGPYSRTMQAIEEVFSLQAGIPTPWALFITFRNMPSEWESEATKQLFSNLQRNIDEFPMVAEAFQNRYQLYNVEQLADSESRICISQSVSKWLTDRAHHYSFSIQQFKHYMYSRYNEGLPTYDIYKHLFVLAPGVIHSGRIPTKGLPSQGWMIENLVSCVQRHHPKNVEEALLAIEDRGKPIIREIQNDIELLCKQIT